MKAGSSHGELRRLVANRADRLCEYCLLHEDDTFFGCEIDHVVSRKHGGPTQEDNLAYACLVCNRRKGSDISSLSPETGELVRLFNRAAPASPLLRRSDHGQARDRFEQALDLYERLPEPYSIGWAHRRLARIGPDSGQRRRHVEAARAAWLGIKRPDLVEEWLKEFDEDGD